MSTRTSARGHSLIELLVTLVVSAVALLGLVAVQARSLSMQVDSDSRRHAVALVEQLRERVVANHEGYARALDARYAGTWLENDAPAAPACGTVMPCDAVTGTPAFQLAQWMQDVRARLPGSIARIAPTTAGSVQAMSVTVGWTQPQSRGSIAPPDNGCGAIPGYAERAEFRCVTVVFFPG